MVCSSVLYLVTAILLSVNGAPHHDGSEGESHTHAPVIAPDSEAIMAIESKKFAEIHHSDISLGDVTKPNNTDMPHIPLAPAVVDAAEIHHSVTYMTENPNQIHTTVMPSDKLVDTSSGTTEKLKLPQKNDDLVNKKSLVARPPVAPDSENLGGKHSFSSGSKGSSVVAHGPMAKNVEDVPKKHHELRNHPKSSVDPHSTVHHAPMATEHHPPKSNAHHSSSKHAPSGAHAPFGVHHTVDDGSKVMTKVEVKRDKPPEDHKLKEIQEGEPIKPIASVVEGQPKVPLAHHPLLSKSEPFPKADVEGLSTTIKPEKEPEPIITHEGIKPAEPEVTNGPAAEVKEKHELASDSQDQLSPKTNVHHPFLSKTDNIPPPVALPKSIALEETAKKVEADMSRMSSGPLGVS